MEDLRNGVGGRPIFLGKGSGDNRQELSGLRFDDLNRIRVLDEDASSQAGELRDTCEEFLGAVSEFGTIARALIEMLDKLTAEVDRQKMRAIGAQNLLQTCAKQRETRLSQLTALIREQQLTHDRLEAEFNSLVTAEAAQMDFMEQFALQK